MLSWALLVSRGETQHTESSFCAQTHPWHWAGHWLGGYVGLSSQLEECQLPWFWTSLKIKGFSPSSHPEWGLEAVMDIPALASGYSCAVPHPCVCPPARGSQLGGTSCWGHSGHRDRPGVTVPDGAWAPQGPRHYLGWQCPREFCCSPCPASSWTQHFKGVTQNQPVPSKGGSSHAWPRDCTLEKTILLLISGMSVLRCQSQHLHLVRALGTVCSWPGLCSQLGIAVDLVLNVPLVSLSGSLPASADRRGWHSKIKKKKKSA